MELVRDDRSVIEFKEGQRYQLGRGTGFAVERDESVSRVHVVVELLRPTSRKGKEAVGKSPALKLHVRVVGRNPICIVSQVEDKDFPRVKFSGSGENDWLVPGDMFALSIRRPVFFLLRQCSSGSLGTDVKGESLSMARNVKTVASNLNRPSEKNVVEVKSSCLEEEEGIAKAVARRHRRRLEREDEKQRMRLNEQHQSENGGLKRSDQAEPNAESHEGNSAVAGRSSNDSHLFDPVSEFGFIVEGSEFQMYEKRSKTHNGLAWNWNIDKKAENEDECFEDENMLNKCDRNSRTGVKTPIPLAQEDDSQEFEDDSQESEDGSTEKKHITKVVGTNNENKIVTRLSRSNNSDLKRSSQELSKRSGRGLNYGEDLTGFIVDDDDSIDEEVQEEWMDDDRMVSSKTKEGYTNGKNQKQVCKYGSNCYRKNKEHLSQYSHPQR